VADRIGRLRHRVTLDDPVEDGTPVTFHPDSVACELQSTGESDERVVTWTVHLRYHAQVTFNTRITMADGRQMFVRGITNYGNADRSGWMSLRCEEVLTP
jgi:hypothetical protein